MAWDNAFGQQMLELALTDEDFEDFHRERSIKQPKVTKEEIQQLTINENLTPFKKICHILRNGQEVQQLYALEHVSETLKILPNSERKIVLQLITELLSLNSCKEIIIVAGHSVCQSVSEGSIGKEDFASNFFQYAITSLKIKDKEISEAWLSALVCSIKMLSSKNIEEVLDFLDDSVSLSRCTTTRRSCCKIVSNLVEVLQPEKVLSCLVPKMKALCQDIELDIRSCMCSELEHMVAFSRKDITERYILPELLLLFEDEETSVREVCFSTITNILPKLNAGYIEKSKIVYHVVQFYKKSLAKKLPDNMIIAAKYIGKFLHFLKALLDEDDVIFFLESFQTLCSYGVPEATSSFCIDTRLLSLSAQSMRLCTAASSHYDKSSECRYWCAYNFPAIVCMLPTGTYKDHLHPCFVLLVKDYHPSVRKTMASCLHEIAFMLTPTADVHFLYNSLKTLLKDSDVEVIDSVLSHLPATLDCFLDDRVSQTHVPDLVPILIFCEQELSKSLRWRTYEKLLRGVSCLHKHLTSDQIYYKLIPVIFNVLIASRVRPVKLAAAHTVLLFIKHNTNLDERNELCTKIITEFAQSTCSRSRIFFIDVCYHVAELFSKSFFKHHFYDILMSLATDPAGNVRLKFCKALPLLKSQIKLPFDRLLLQMLEQTVRRIMALENDADVSNTIRNVINELDSVRLTMEGTPLNEDDLLDRNKELEEEKIDESCHQSKHEEHGRSMSLCVEKCAAAEKLLSGKRNRKSGSFSGGVTYKEISKKVPSKGSLTNSTVSSPKKAGASKQKEIPTSKSGGSASKLTSKKSSSHTTKRTK